MLPLLTSLHQDQLSGAPVFDGFDEAADKKRKNGGRKTRGGRSARGWGKKSPRTRRERQRVYDKCGRKCFLGKDLSFPVCSKYTRKCKRDRAGVCAARYRADQYDHKEIARKARRILEGERARPIARRASWVTTWTR